MINEEKWLQVIGFPDYSISDFGNVYSLKCKRLLIPAFTYNGYLIVKLINDEGRRYKKRIHRLVAETWQSMPPAFSLEIDHVNDVRYDNRLNNLEWVTRNENLKRKRRRHKILKSLKSNMEAAQK